MPSDMYNRTEPTTSSFMMIVNNYCDKTRPKIVNYALTSNSSNEDSRKKLGETSENEHRVSSNPGIEHCDRMVVNAVDIDATKSQLSSFIAHGEIGVFVKQHGDVKCSSIFCHTAPALCEGSGPWLSMVSHLCISNHVSVQPPAVPEVKFDLWQHILNMQKCTFSRAVKRKAARESERGLCESFETLRLSKVKEPSL